MPSELPLEDPVPPDTRPDPDPGEPYPVPDPGEPYPVPDPGEPYPVPDPAVVTGQHFGGALMARVGGAKATFRVPRSTKLVLTVPAGARSGRISIHTSAGTAVSPERFSLVA
jgi:hypothetical protein